jgi:isochorismate pyruvate lyase
MINCKNIDEVRTNIDLIDREIVKLLCERSNYVRQAAKFKKSTQDVRAPNRVEEVILKVRNMASEYGLDPEIVEPVYRTMIACLIEHEMKEHSKLKIID